MNRLAVTAFSIFAILASLSAHGAPDGQETSGKSDAQSEAPRIVVVVSKKNPISSVTEAELARIFLRKKNHWPNGVSITVFERPVGNRIRREFSLDVLQKKPEALREYWMNLKLTRGLKPPKVLRSAKLVKRYLARVKGGIGYLYADEADETVRTIEIVRKK